MKKYICLTLKSTPKKINVYHKTTNTVPYINFQGRIPWAFKIYGSNRYSTAQNKSRVLVKIPACRFLIHQEPSIIQIIFKNINRLTKNTNPIRE